MIDGVMRLLQDGPPIRRNRKGELYQMNRNQRKHQVRFWVNDKELAAIAR